MIYNYTKISVKYIRIGLDTLMVGTGLILGAPIGIGTFLCVVAVGLIFEWTMNRFIHK